MNPHVLPRLVILESPYKGDIEKNVEYARRASRACAERGEAAFASHLLFTQFLDDSNDLERQVGINFGLAWRARAQYSVFYTDLGWSSGMHYALATALREHKIFYLRAFSGINLPDISTLVQLCPLPHLKDQETLWAQEIVKCQDFSDR